jgi:hypothetical protein
MDTTYFSVRGCPQQEEGGVVAVRKPTQRREGVRVLETVGGYQLLSITQVVDGNDRRGCRAGGAEESGGGGRSGDADDCEEQHPSSSTRTPVDLHHERTKTARKNQFTVVFSVVCVEVTTPSLVNLFAQCSLLLGCNTCVGDWDGLATWSRPLLFVRWMWR